MFICRIFDVHIILRTRTTYNVPVQRIVRQVLVELYSIIYHTNACAMARNSACGNCMHDVGDAQAECMWRCARRDCMNARVRNFRAKFCAKFRAKSDISHHLVPANASSHRANTSTMCANRRAAHIRRVVAANPSSLLVKNHRSSEAPPSSPGSPIPIFHCTLLRS